MSVLLKQTLYTAIVRFFMHYMLNLLIFNQSFRFIFLGIYSCECVIRTIAKGFILNNYTYLRNAWNWLDFLVIFSGYLTSFIEMGNLAGLRTFRVLRALKTIAILPSKYHSHLIWRAHFLLLLRENLKLESTIKYKDYYF